ncbi:hypothetical protein D3C76_1033840 [compost metagenome]
MGIAIIIHKNPTKILRGIPKIITFNCGTDLETNPMQTSAIIIINTIGIAIFKPIIKYCEILKKT